MGKRVVNPGSESGDSDAARLLRLLTGLEDEASDSDRHHSGSRTPRKVSLNKKRPFGTSSDTIDIKEAKNRLRFGKLFPVMTVLNAKVARNAQSQDRLNRISHNLSQIKITYPLIEKDTKLNPFTTAKISSRTRSGIEFRRLKVANRAVVLASFALSASMYVTGAGPFSEVSNTPDSSSIDTTVPGATEPGLTLPPESSPPEFGQAPGTEPVPAPGTELAPPPEAAPPAPKFTAAAGAIVCEGLTSVVIEPADRGSALRAMKRVTGEPFTELPSETVPEFIDALNAFNANPPSGSEVITDTMADGQSFQSPVGCTGLVK